MCGCIYVENLGLITVFQIFYGCAHRVQYTGEKEEEKAAVTVTDSQSKLQQCCCAVVCCARALTWPASSKQDASTHTPSSWLHI